ncbi:MAG: TetR/AcrR family transcriptional regulator [Oscillospiraceae bacterium]|nr:TetR/AcrR family transcriptional regulator [Oscillospiraceae bacterium]
MSSYIHSSMTKQRILECAASIFAKKGFADTSVRELAIAAGLKNPASLYHHFPSKNAILEEMMEEYAVDNTDIFEMRNIDGILLEKPNADGILACLQTAFPADKIAYYMNVLCVMLQEQLRNPNVGRYISDQLVLRAEINFGKIIDALIKLEIIDDNIDSDYWSKIVSSLFYTFALRMMLGIGDNQPEFTGKGMEGLLRESFNLMLELHGTK